MSILYKGVNQRGFGTWPLKGAEAQAAVESALDVGYRAIDTAQMYENEAEVGAAIAASGLPRDNVCITTKVHPDNFGEDRFLASVEGSISKLGSVPDVLLLHWPPAGGDVSSSLKLLQQAFDRGMAASIGISNYTVAMMETAAKILETPIAANQVELHPLVDQSTLIAGASRLGIPLSSYCSIAKGKVMEQPDLIEIGVFHGKSAAQVSLRWLLQKGVNPIVMSTKRKNQKANFDVMDFTLSNVEMARIDALATRLNSRIVTHTPWVPEWDV